MHSLSGFRALILLWSGQLVSALGSRMTWFAFTVWAWKQTEQATTLALVQFFAYAPMIFSPLAGVYVDRWPRKRILILSDSSAAVCTVVVLVLFFFNSLAMWHLYIIAAFAGTMMTLQYPAYNASVTLLVDKKHYSRAYALTGIGEGLGRFAAPTLAAILLAHIGFAGVLGIDVLTFFVALLTLFFIAIPFPKKDPGAVTAKAANWQQVKFSWHYIVKRRGLFTLLIFTGLAYMVTMIGMTLIPPMVLAKTGRDQVVLGVVESAGALGGIAGGVLVMVWGGPRKKINGILFGGMGVCFFGLCGLGLGRSLVTWALGHFFLLFFAPIVLSSDMAIWQQKIPPGIQGRIFGMKEFVNGLTVPLGILVAGPLADQAAEPFMSSTGWLQHRLRTFAGTGPGSGMALLLLSAGLVVGIICLLAFGSRTLRTLESSLPDWDKKET